jgi:hypothetical protein
MGALSIWHIIIILLFLGLFALGVLSIAKILRRMGFSGWWTVVALIPFVSIIGLWMLANKKWPAFDKSAD